MINNMQRAEKKYIKIGHTLLCATISNQVKANTLKEYENKINKKNWAFNSLIQLKTQQWTAIFACIHETSCEQIKIVKVSNQRMLKSICHPIYKSLRQLSLIESKIDSIEFLPFINAESMISLELRRNELTCLKPLNKLNLKELAYIQLSQNPIVEVGINRISMKPQSNCLWLQEKESFDAMGADLNFLLQLPFQNSMKSTNFALGYEDSRVRQDKVVVETKRKFPN